MSNALFDDTVTLYCRDGNEALHRFAIPMVRLSRVGTGETGVCEAEIYLPLYGRRSLRYLSPDVWEGRPGTFTVRPGDRIVCRPIRDPAPPENALTVRSIGYGLAGSRRLRHLKIAADNKKEETSHE